LERPGVNDALEFDELDSYFVGHKFALVEPPLKKIVAPALLLLRVLLTENHPRIANDGIALTGYIAGRFVLQQFGSPNSQHIQRGEHDDRRA
jgi:hypothetical protein